MKINLTAPVNSLGWGVASLNLLLALDRLGHEVAWWPLGPTEAPPHAHEALRRAEQRRGLYDSEAPSVRFFHPNDLAQHVGRGLKVGFTMFEVDGFTEVERHHLASQDLLLVPSGWAREVILGAALVGTEEVDVVPLGVDTTLFRPDPEKDHGGPTTFLCVGKWEYRKGHSEVLEAFQRAFSPSDDVRLVMHCHNPCLPEPERTRYNQSWASYYRLSPLSSKIELSAARYSGHDEVADLMRGAHCGVFPSRAEGWNLPLLEMMALGKPVIATDYSAHTEFCDGRNALLVVVTETETAEDGQWFHGQGNWAKMGEPQINEVASHMRAVHRARQEGVPETLFNEEGVKTARRFSWENSAKALVSALKGFSS